MEEELKKVLKVIGKVVKNTLRIILLPLLPFILIIILLAGAVYFITVDDGTFKEDDWTSPGYGAAVYKSETTVNADGTISASTSAQEIWDKLVEEGSPITAYLDSAEELAKLMNAEIITQYPDTRSNPDAPIDWDSIINGDSLQGIIKFKRSDENGNKSTMTYVDPDTFQSYINEYNETGSETAKNNALSHFTIKKSTNSSGSSVGGAVAAGDGVMTDVSQAILNAANEAVTPWPGIAQCAGWVDNVYANAGLEPCRHTKAYYSYEDHHISDDMSAIPIGAAVYGTGSGQIDNCGHIGIYIGGR